MAKITHDGLDYQHRQRILPHYQILALTKKRLKFVVILHLFLAFIMAAKLVPTILDKLNIFWQPIEELYIPTARIWEFVWFAGVLTAPLAFGGIRTNSTSQLKLFSILVVLICLGPVFYCAYHYGSDFRTFVQTRDASKTSEVWRNYPVAIYWYIFIGVSIQVHAAELYFTWDFLKSISSSQRKKR